MQVKNILNRLRNKVINFSFIVLFLFSFKVSAQNDTIYFDQNWKTSNKETALYFRIKPLKIKTKNAVGYKIKDIDSLYIIHDYYLKNNKLQFEGYATDQDGEYLSGTAKWYKEDGSLIESRDFNYKEKSRSSGFKIPKWPIIYLDYKIAAKSQFAGGLEFCLDCENDNKLFLGLGFGVTNYYGNSYGLPDLHLSYNTSFLFAKGGLSDKHAYALAGVTLLNIIDLGFGYSQPFDYGKAPVIKGFTFGATFRFSNNQKAYSEFKIM